MVDNKRMELKDDITFITTAELSEYLHISMDKVYALVNYEDFPSIRIGRRILISKEKLNIWLNHHMYKSVKL